MLRKIARQIAPPGVARLAKAAVLRVTAPQVFARNNELHRLKQLPPGCSTTTHILGYPFEVPDGRSFAHLYELYFGRELYRFECSTDAPYILDCGANIGVTVAWWKKQYPNARVVAFEADPDIFAVLQRNCSRFKNVKLINAAVWDKDGELSFVAKGGEGGHLAEFSSGNRDQLRSVPCVRLRDFLQEKCDFLKMDIEGAEVEVIRDCAGLLKNVYRAFIEYHSFLGRQQFLGQTISALEDAGFRLHAHVELPSPKPFHQLEVLNDKDLRLDLFCYREATSPKISQRGNGTSLRD